MIVFTDQNVFDVALQHYGSLNELVRLCVDNNLSIDEVPPQGLEILFIDGVGDQNIRNWTAEQSHIFSNAAVEAKSVLLAADDTALSPEDDTQFIYK